jgi:uncharacterized surface protein with fasciclin (FAS1) repeats
MKIRSVLSILTLLVLLLGIALVPVGAQEEDAAPGLVVDAPDGYDVTNSTTTDNVRFEMGSEAILVFGPDTYTQILGSEEFEDDESELAFFMDRSGFSVGDAGDSEQANVLATLRVSLARRQQQGIAYLVDLGVGQRGVVVSLHTGRGRVGAPPIDADVVLDSIAFPLSILEALETEGSFTILLAAAEAAGMGELPEGSLTMFAPNDAAFEAMFFSLGLSQEQVFAASWLDDVLLYHVVEGSIDSSALAESYTDQNSISTLLELNNISVFTGVDGLLYVNNNQAEIVGTDIMATNGVIHTIDGVLLPQCAIDAINGDGGC